MKNKIIFLFILLIIGIGIFFRLYNLNWGAPFYFHPDERNIASSISQLKFPNQLNPHFFAYGSIPLYTILAIGLSYNIITTCNFSLQNCIVSFEQAIVIGRIISALLSVGILFLLYLTGKKLASHTVGICAVILASFSTGLIQYSHFSTFEMWLTFFSLLLFYATLKLQESNNLKNILITGMLLGILIGTKISSIILIALPLCALLLNKHVKNRKNIFRAVFYFLLIVLSGTIIFSISNPFSLLDFKNFQSTLSYESSVALGTLPVFYTGEFYGKIPILFQFLNVYPFILNPVITILFIFSFLYLLIIVFKTKNKSYFLLIAFYLLLFISQAFLFAKWTRYIIPTLPFAYLIIAVFLQNFFKRKNLNLYNASIVAFVFFSFVFSFSYVKTALLDPDTRIEASLWAKKHIPSDSKILSEIYDMGITPFNSYFTNIKLFHFYDLDNNSFEWSPIQLNKELTETNYIILPSQRISKVRIQNPNEFPKGSRFYKKLFDRSLGFTKIYETPCDIFCKIVYLNSPTAFEQTSSVFDRPTVMIFKNDE